MTTATVIYLSREFLGYSEKTVAIIAGKIIIDPSDVAPCSGAECLVAVVFRDIRAEGSLLFFFSQGDVSPVFFGAPMMKRLSTSVAVLLVVFGALMFGAADRARADNIYYVGTNNGVATLLARWILRGHTTTIATGLSFGGAGRKS